MPSTAVLLSYHGTVQHSDELPGFLQNIRRGRSAPDAIIAEVARRLKHIGGSPLRRTSEAQAAALEDRLGVPVRAAGRLWHPYPSEVLAPWLEHGLERLISLPLAPQSVHIYHRDVEEALSGSDVEIIRAPAWGCVEPLVGAFLRAIEEAARGLTADDVEKLGVIVSAHSLPQQVIDAGDPYERDFRALAGTVIGRLGEIGLGLATTRIAFQSEGLDGGVWLRPRLADEMKQLAQAGLRDLLIAPIGFVADHVETLYDIDVEAAELARELGFRSCRRMPGMDLREDFIDALESVARPLL
jgi:ferrochelatase